MASGCRIVAHNNEFNRSVLGEEAVYFDEAESLGRYLAEDKPWPASWPAKHRQTITEQYSPERIMGAYLHLLQQCAKPS
jgi:glycosyltransferase involved in cell wall biosynthesis